jgi:hypothetical protein
MTQVRGRPAAESGQSGEGAPDAALAAWPARLLGHAAKQLAEQPLLDAVHLDDLGGDGAHQLADVVGVGRHLLWLYSGGGRGGGEVDESL